MPQKTVLIVGSGGREHTLAWALARSPQVAQVYVAPGNAGTAWLANPTPIGLQPRAAAENIPLAVDDTAGLVAFARQQAIDLTVVGPEAPLAAGLVDAFQAAGLAVFGPIQAAAQLEASKSFSKNFMRDHGIPTGDYAVFTDHRAAVDYLEAPTTPPVIKADGLAGGKGVLLCETLSEAKAAVSKMMLEGKFGRAGQTVVIEEQLYGPEISILAWCDGQTVVPILPARDHKRVFDDDQGPNTGGMGAYAPAPDIDAALIDEIQRTVLEPTLNGMAAQGTPYVGILYAGLMLTQAGPKVLEFNCRFGDPETQAVLPLLETDLFEIFEACITERLAETAIRWSDESCATVVMSSPGYPGDYPTGLPINGITAANSDPHTIVFQAGTALDKNGQLVTAGGRVLAVTSIGPDLGIALNRAYSGVGYINFEKAHFRHDIGRNYGGSA